VHFHDSAQCCRMCVIEYILFSPSYTGAYTAVLFMVLCTFQQNNFYDAPICTAIPIFTVHAHYDGNGCIGGRRYTIEIGPYKNKMKKHSIPKLYSKKKKKTNAAFHIVRETSKRRNCAYITISCYVNSMVYNPFEIIIVDTRTDPVVQTRMIYTRPRIIEAPSRNEVSSTAYNVQTLTSTTLLIYFVYHKVLSNNEYY